MVGFFTQTFHYDHPWSQVTCAVFQKYPNPFASHVLASDVVDRYVDAQGVLHSTRLFLKKGTVPKWGRALLGKSEAYILETSTVDPKTRTMTTVTRNLSLTKLMLVQETQTIKPIVNGTQIVTSAKIVSNVGWSSIRERIENFGLKRFKDNSARSSKGLEHVLEKLDNTLKQ